MKLFVRLTICGVIALLSLEDCRAANGRRPRTGVVGTFGTLNSVQSRRAPVQQSRRTSLSGSSGLGRRSGSSGMGGVPGMSGLSGMGGVQGMTGVPNINSMTGVSGATSSSRRTTGRQTQGAPTNLTGQRRTTKRNGLGPSVRSSLPPANSQR